MVRLYYPPAALLPHANRDVVELAGAKCLIAIDDEKEFFTISNIFNEISMGHFWQEAAISDQIEKISVTYEDADALYDSNVLIERVVDSFEQIIARELIFFGVSSFEGNAFETSVQFEEFDNLDMADIEKLKNIYKSSRVADAFPNIMQGKFVEINFFGEGRSFFSLENKKTLKEIAGTLYPYAGEITGIVAVAQGAANFIILTHNMFSCSDEEDEDIIDQKTLHQMFDLINKDVLKSPISWFKFNLGLKGIESLDGWNDIKDNPKVKAVIEKYKKYLFKIISAKKERNEMENILDEDTGNPIVYGGMTEEELEDDMDIAMEAINEFNELQIETKEISLLYKPPKLLFSVGDFNQTAIGGGMYMLSMDVGKSIDTVGTLRENISWGEFFLDDEQERERDTFYDLEEAMDFVEYENPIELRDAIQRAFQNIITDNELFFGVLELESNGFEFSLFNELTISDINIELLKFMFDKKIMEKKAPHFEENHIEMKWIGQASSYFTNPECYGILDLAAKFKDFDMYNKKFITGVVCADQDSTYFYILTNNFISEKAAFDQTTFETMMENIGMTNQVPLSWFKISLGLDSLKLHPYWKSASQYGSLLRVIDNYNRFFDKLIEIHQSESLNYIY